MITIADDEVLPISLATVVSSTAIGMDLYVRSPKTDRIMLYRGAEYPMCERDLSRLRARGIKQLYIMRSERERYQSYLREIATSECVDAADYTARLVAITAVIRDVLEGDFRSRDDGRIVRSAVEFGVLTTELIQHDQFAAQDMLRVLHHDYATFTHSANVAFYAAILAAEMGLPPSDVQQIVAGGLLHDLGKLQIDEKILWKPGRLDDAERRVIQMHPTEGFRRLARRPELSAGQLMMVYQHHERLDGRGYPTACVDHEIHVWAKICAVADVFEALTSHRPYRSPMTRDRALEVMRRGRGTAFDPEILACWEALMTNS